MILLRKSPPWHGSLRIHGISRRWRLLEGSLDFGVFPYSLSTIRNFLGLLFSLAGGVRKSRDREGPGCGDYVQAFWNNTMCFRSENNERFRCCELYHCDMWEDDTMQYYGG